jgi:MATE family, multidrug efflux pump
MAFGLRKVEPEEMGTGGVASTLLRMAIPTAVAGLLMTLFQVVDMLFISWLGKSQVSGVGLAFPVIFFVYAVGQAAGVGSSILISRHLGERNPKASRVALEQALLISVCIGGAFTACSPLVVRPLLMIMGPSSDVLIHAEAYLSRILLGAILFHIALVADSGLRAQGNTMTGMKIAVLGNAVNLLLDGFFIFGPNHLPHGMPDVPVLRELGQLYVHWGLDLGVQGGATITVLCRLLTVALLLRSLLSRRSHIRPFLHAPRRLRFDAPVLKRIYTLGFPATVSIVGMSVSAFLINLILMKVNGEEVGKAAVGAFFIAHRMEMFAFMPVFSLGSALVPMVSYNMGAHDPDRCRRAIVVGCLMAGSTMAAVGVVLFAFPRQFFTIFTNAEDMIDMGSQYLRINTLSYFVIGCDVMLSSGLQGLGRSDLSMVAQLIRTIIVKVPVAWVLSWGLGVTGVWIASPISTAACFVFALTAMRILLRRMRQGAGLPPAVPEIAESGP